MRELTFPTIPATAKAVKLEPTGDPLFYCSLGMHYQPRSGFHASYTRPRGIESSCKACLNARWRARNPHLTGDGRKRRDPRMVNGVEVLPCTICKRDRPVERFTTRPSKKRDKTLYRSHCKDCEREYKRQHQVAKRKTDPEGTRAQRERDKAIRQAHRDAAREDQYQLLVYNVGRLKADGWTYRRIGEAIDVTPATVSRWLAGNRSKPVTMRRANQKLAPILQTMPQDAFLGPVARPERRERVKTPSTRQKPVEGKGRGHADYAHKRWSSRSAASAARHALRQGRSTSGDRSGGTD